MGSLNRTSQIIVQLPSVQTPFLKSLCPFTPPGRPSKPLRKKTLQGGDLLQNILIQELVLSHCKSAAELSSQLMGRWMNFFALPLYALEIVSSFYYQAYQWFLMRKNQSTIKRTRYMEQALKEK